MRGRLPLVMRKGLVVALLAASLAGALFAPPARAGDPHASPTGSATASSEDLRSFVPGAAALEGKILAPCCWIQTVDIHGSELGNAIRREIRTRLRAGESPDAIEASFVARYGAKIIAVQSDSPLAGIAVTVLLVMGGVGIAGFAMLKRWKRAGTKASGSRDDRDEASNARLDARLDAELRALDE
jgi:cytochrome c-type biogenesis protein CcmH